MPFIPLPLSLLLPAAALAAVPLRHCSFFFFFFFAAAFFAAALAAALAASSVPNSSSPDVAVGVLPRVARARLPARDGRRHEVDRALGVYRDEQRPPAPRLEGDACFFVFVLFRLSMCVSRGEKREALRKEAKEMSEREDNGGRR